jgi:SSS family solute:Na+ symporter
MAQNFWTAIWAWSVCFAVTILISLCTRAPQENSLVGLVYSLTEKPDEEHLAWYMRPAVLGAIVIGIAVVLNLIFW